MRAAMVDDGRRGVRKRDCAHGAMRAAPGSFAILPRSRRGGKASGLGTRDSARGDRVRLAKTPSPESRVPSPVLGKVSQARRLEQKLAKLHLIRFFQAEISARRYRAWGDAAVAHADEDDRFHVARRFGAEGCPEEAIFILEDSLAGGGTWRRTTPRRGHCRRLLLGRRDVKPDAVGPPSRKEMKYKGPPFCGAALSRTGRGVIKRVRIDQSPSYS